METVLFFCSFGGAKSVIAASYFNRLAEELALPYAAIAVAAEEPYEAVPAPVAGLLEREGFEVRAFKPRRAEAGDVTAARRIVSIDCGLAQPGVAGAVVERWDDVPQASVDLDGSAAAIRAHVEELVAELRERG